MTSLQNNKWLSFFTIALLMANVVTLGLLWASSNKPPNQAGPPPPEPVFEFVTRQLGLNKKQQEIYSTLREEHQRLQRPAQDSLAMARNAFFELLKNPSVSDSVITLYNKKTLAFQQQIELINFRHFQQLRAIGDSEQQSKFDEIIQTVLRRIAGQGTPGRRPPPPTGEGERRRPPPPDGERESRPPPPAE